MPSYDDITDEEQLHKMMNETENFEERKAIRARLRQIRDKQREEMEAKRKEREARAEDHVKKKFLQAEEDKRKTMEAYKNVAPTHERDSKYHTVSQSLIQEKQKQADADKAAKMAAYSNISVKTGPGGEKITTAVVTESTPGGGSVSTVKKTVEKTSQGFGTAYGAAAKPAAKPAGPKGAMAAFKQMDNSANPSPVKPKISRSPSAIKQVLLDWTKAMTREYTEVEITNFSSSWNNGMAFCALIHHFYPDSFDFKSLDPKQRRKNFELAFDTAEKEADIAPLLDVEDMVRMKTPDWKCVFTYVQSIYRHLKDHERNKTQAAEQ